MLISCGLVAFDGHVAVNPSKSLDTAIARSWLGLQCLSVAR